MDDKEDILEQLREGLRQHQDYYQADGRDDIQSLTTSSVISLDFSDLTTNINTGPTFNWPSTPSTPITISGSGTSATWGQIGINNGINRSSKIALEGENADIEINGESLCGMIRGIQERLNILCPDPEMEQEWDELREIREQYETKLAQCKEKSRAWKALKS